MNKLFISLLLFVSIFAFAGRAFSEDMETGTGYISTEQREAIVFDAIKNSTKENPFYKNTHYQNFIFGILVQDTPTLQTVRVLKLSAQKLVSLYQNESNYITQGDILGQIHRLLQHALNYSKHQKNEILSKYFLELKEFQTTEQKIRMGEVDTTKTEYVPSKELQEEVFVERIKQFVKRISNNSQQESQVFEFREGTIEIVFKDLLVEKKIGNVLVLADKASRQKIFSIKIVVPNTSTHDAVLIATKALLSHESVAGVYFDDYLKVPNIFTKNSYELSSLGSNVLVKRPSCSRLFQ